MNQFVGTSENESEPNRQALEKQIDQLLFIGPWLFEFKQVLAVQVDHE
jgi:hypothetical protein